MNGTAWNITDVGQCRNGTRITQVGTPYYYVGIYWFPVVFVIGVLGNVLNLIVLTADGMRTKTNYFLSAMAVTDLCFFLVMLIFNLSSFDSLAVSNSFMEVYFQMKMTLMVLANWFSTASIWVAVAVTVERLVAIRWPLHARLFWSSRLICIILVCIFLASLYLASHNWIWMWPVSVPRCDGGRIHGLQMLRQQDSPTLYAYFLISRSLAIFLSVVIPVIALMFLNSWLVYSLRRARREMAAKFEVSTEQHSCLRGKRKARKPSRHRQSSTSAVRHKANETKVAFMVFFISAAFVIFELPSAILYIWDICTFIAKRPERSASFQLATYFSNQLVTLNKAVNFIVYCGSGQHFRHKFLNIICKRFPFKRFYYGSRQNSRFYFSWNDTSATVGSIRATPSGTYTKRRSKPTTSQL